MKRFYISTCILLLAVLIFAIYSEKDMSYRHYVLFGENEQWKAVYRVTGMDGFTHKKGVLDYKSNLKGTLAVAYKGDLSDLYPVKYLEISYESDLVGGKYTRYTENDHINQRIFTFGSSSSDFFPDSDIHIKVTIKLDKNIQTFDLQQQKNDELYITPPRLKLYFTNIN